MILGITGHRKFYHPKDDIRAATIDFIQQHNPHKTIVGMAMGYDHLIAEICVELKIPFVAAIPCDSQDKFWTISTKKKHAQLLNQATEIVHVNHGLYKPWKMIARNRWIVDNCQQLLCYVVQNSGGSKTTIEYAYKLGKPVHNIYNCL